MQTCVETAQQCIDNCKDAGITMAQYLLNRAGYIPGPDTMARLTAVKSSKDAWSTQEDTGYVMEQLDPEALGVGEEGPWSFEDPPSESSIAGFPAPISCYHRLANSPSAPKSFASNLAQSYKLTDDEKKMRLSMLFLDTKDYMPPSSLRETHHVDPARAWYEMQFGTTQSRRAPSAFGY